MMAGIATDAQQLALLRCEVNTDVNTSARRPINQTHTLQAKNITEQISQHQIFYIVVGKINIDMYLDIALVLTVMLRMGKPGFCAWLIHNQLGLWINQIN